MLTDLILLNVNTVRAQTDMEQNLLNWIFFLQDIQLRKLISLFTADCLTLCPIYFNSPFQIHPNSILSTEIAKDAF